MKVLNPFKLPLTESALIEASAGTGKTFTITTLYLRAILGLRDEGPSLKPLTVDEILVVTFTEAATQEIKDRVRAKLVAMQKLIVFYSAKAQSVSNDPAFNILEEYIERSEYEGANAQQALDRAYRVISAALVLIDEASIYTIHGFCNRTLSRFAFESKISFEQNFEMDDQEYVTLAIYDFWRKHIASLSGIQLNWFRKNWKAPQALLQSLRPLINRKISLSPEMNSTAIKELYDSYESGLQRVREGWLSAQFGQVLLDSGLKKSSRIIKRLPKIEPFLQGLETEVQFNKGEDWSLFGSESLGETKNYKAKAPQVDHPLIKEIDELVQAQRKLATGAVKSYWLQFAKEYVECRSEQVKTERSVLTPDDLLIKLHSALDADESAKLAGQVRKAHPLAMVDEFQDTDAIQYGIFQQIYLSEGSDEANLLMIGDPKQAIYKFRGADIFTYIAAKQALGEDNLYTLDTNWRSHPKLVASINGMFANSETQFDHKLIPFQPVKSGLSEHKVLIEQNQTQCLDVNVLLKDDDVKGLKPAEAEAMLARLCAVQIKQTLIHSDQGSAYIANGDQSKAVRAGDICVLVRTRRQASLIKKELAKISVSSVFISRDNIFNTAIASDFLRLLHAIHEPQSETKVRAALTTVFFNQSLQSLQNLFQNSEKWHELYSLFYTSHEHWIAGRTALAINNLLDHQESLAKWLKANERDTNRNATDFRHLVELLQLKSKEVVGREKLISWFEQQIDPNSFDGNGEANQLRLESDSNLVQIATLHASKGLEYPIVYLPFVCEFREAKDAVYNSENSGLVYRVDNREIELQRAEKERLAEDIRLLYVALTRPVYKLVMSVFNLQDRFGNNELNKTALSQLLNLSEVQTDEALQLSLSSSVESLNNNGGLANLNTFRSDDIQTLFNQSLAYHIKEPESESEIVLPRLTHKVQRNWQMWSYSSLVGYMTSQANLETEVEIAGSNDELHEPSVTPESDEKSKHTFPKGANAGTCLHELYENLNFTQPVEQQGDVIETALSRYGYDLQWRDIVIQWCQTVLEQEINGFQLSQLSDQEKLVEMEFYFVVENMEIQVFGNALSMMGINVNLLGLTEIAPKGIIKGFIDLIYRHNGKYYVLDYKSNYLGSNSESYSDSNMHFVMTDHNYYLQALIYILALHRYLRNIVADYSYEKYIGGAVYLFLRGCEGGDSTNGVKAFDIKEDVINYLDNALLDVATEATKPLEVNHSADTGIQNDFGF